MLRLSADEVEAVRDISEELRTVRLDQPSSIAATLPRIRQFVEVDSMLVFCPTERLVGWGLERIDVDNLPDARGFTNRFTSYLAHAPRRFAFFDPLDPEPEQRDRVMDAVSLIAGDVYRSSCMYREVLVPSNLARHRQLRALVCDGGSLLGWFGAFHDGDLAPRHHRRLTALLPAMRQRLSVDRLLRRPQLVSAALDLILDQIGDAAFLVGTSGELVFANHAGRALLGRDRGQTVEALQLALRGRGERASCTIVPLASQGLPPTTLVVLRKDCEDSRIDRHVDTAAARWGLTTRQRDVLRLLVRGHANATLAEMLGICERTVELHITAMFDRVGLDSRAALVARVLLMV